MLAGLVALGGAFLLHNDTWKTILGTYQGMWDIAIGLAAFLATPFVDALNLVGAVLKGDWSAALDIISGRIERLTNVLAFLRDTAVAAGSAIASAFSSGSGVTESIASTQQFAGGGRVRGAGTATSDSIWARVSDGEAITRTRSVNYYGPGLFDALNRMAIPRDLLRAAFASMRGFSLGGLVGSLQNINPPRFAMGGMVEALGATGSAGRDAPVHLHLGGSSFTLQTDREKRDSLVRVARRAHILSAVKKPGSHG